LAKKIANQSSKGFSGSTKDNPKNESCKVIELRSKDLTPLIPKVTKKNEDVVVEEAEQCVVENNENGVI